MYSFCTPDHVCCLRGSSTAPLAGVLPGKVTSALMALCSGAPQVPILVVTKLCWVLFRPHCTKAILCSGQKSQEDFFLSPSGFCFVKPQSNSMCTHTPWLATSSLSTGLHGAQPRSSFMTWTLGCLPHPTLSLTSSLYPNFP